MDKINVVGYVRVSTDNTTQDTSYQGQKKYLEQYCKQHNFELLQVYQDRLSGTSVKNRDGLLQLLGLAGIQYDNTHNVFKLIPNFNPAFKYVLCSNTSRLGRNLRECMDIIENLRAKEVGVIFTDNNINSLDAGGSFHLQLLQLFDQEQSNNLSEKIKAGHRRITETTNNIHSTGRLYGYDLIYKTPNTPQMLIPNKNEEQTVINIFNWFTNEGLGVRRIQNRLREQGIKSRNGKDFSTTAIYNILSNEKYCGLNNRLKYESPPLFSNQHTIQLRKNNVPNFQLSPNIVPIISLELFKKTQEELHKRNRATYIKNSKSEWSGLIYCGLCGKPYYAGLDNGRRYYICSTKAQRGKKGCSNNNISLLKLEAVVLDSLLIQTMLFRLKMTRIQVIKRSISDLKNSININYQHKVQDLRQQLLEAKTRKDRLLQVYLEGVLEKDEYLAQLKPMAENINELNQKIKYYSMSNDQIRAEIVNKEQAINDIKGLGVQQHYTKQEIIQLIDKIIIYPGHKLKLVLKVGQAQIEEELEF